MEQNDKKMQMQLAQRMVDQRAWVKTPWRYTQLGSGLSLIQQQALLMVSEHLQGYIKSFFDMGLDKQRGTPKSMFTEHVLKEGITPFRIYLQDLGVKPSNYKTAREAIEQINLKVEHPEFDERGIPTGRTLMTNVFSQFGFEETGDYYHFESKEGEKQMVELKQPYIDVKINPDVAQWAFDMNQGYVNHLKMIALYSTKRPTPRIYLMLMRSMKRDRQQYDVRISLHELKNYLGISTTAYPMFSNFRQKVLDAVQEDLQRMARQVPPATDITYTYECIYPGTRKKGDPEAVMFHVVRTSLGMAYDCVVNHAHKPLEQALFVSDPMQQPYSDTFRQMIAEIVSATQNLRWRSLRFVEYKGGVLLVRVPDEATYKWVENKETIAVLREYLMRYYPNVKGLNYNIGK